jgi:hypothetical protein
LQMRHGNLLETVLEDLTMHPTDPVSTPMGVN